LATNATKYGALRGPEGRIHVSWAVKQPDRKLVIEWRESGGPAVTPPQRQGFGHNIVDRYVSRTLQAEVSYSFPQEGIVWRMEADNLLI
jgi:two-component sensor histidine kinase